MTAPLNTILTTMSAVPARPGRAWRLLLATLDPFLGALAAGPEPAVLARAPEVLRDLLSRVHEDVRAGAVSAAEVQQALAGPARTQRLIHTLPAGDVGADVLEAILGLLYRTSPPQRHPAHNEWATLVFVAVVARGTGPVPA